MSKSTNTKGEVVIRQNGKVVHREPATNMKDELGEEVETMLVRFLHKHDHEPDEITKYVVIDQTEFAPEVAKVIVDLLAKDRQQLIQRIREEVIGENIDIETAQDYNHYNQIYGSNATKDKQREILETMEKE